MALFVVATPIGNNKDFSLRAIEILREADLIVGEELKVLRQILKAAGVQAKAMDQLNEHSDKKDIEFLTSEARDKMVALVSDCGTPGFADPGAELVAACRRAGVQIYSVPGPSSLMALLSIAGYRLDEFLFAGFLPAKAEDREARLRELHKEKRAVILLETPYRAKKLSEDLGKHFPERRCVLGLNLTQDDELVLTGLGREIAAAQVTMESPEPIVLILP